MAAKNNPTQETQAETDARLLAYTILELHTWSRDKAAAGDATAAYVFSSTGQVIFSASRLKT